MFFFVRTKLQNALYVFSYRGLIFSRSKFAVALFAVSRISGKVKVSSLRDNLLKRKVCLFHWIWNLRWVSKSKYQDMCRDFTRFVMQRWKDLLCNGEILQRALHDFAQTVLHHPLNTFLPFKSCGNAPLCQKKIFSVRPMVCCTLLVAPHVGNKLHKQLNSHEFQ